MSRTLTAASVALLFTLPATALAEPVKLNDAQMDGVTAGQAAMNPFEAITADNPVFEDSELGSIQLIHNTDLRFGQGGAIAIPGEGGFNADDNSAFDLPGRPDLVRPLGHQ